MLLSRQVLLIDVLLEVKATKKTRLGYAYRGCDGQALPVGEGAALVAIIVSFEAKSACRGNARASPRL